MPGVDYYGVVRLGPAGVSFWLDQPCAVERRAVPILEGPLEGRRARAFVDQHQDGDAIVVAPPRGTEGGVLDLVGLTIVGIDRQAASSLRELLAHHRETVREGSAELDYSFALAHCGGELRAVGFEEADAGLCDDSGVCGPVWVTEMRVTRLVP
jgi:hypothetical protein